MNWKPFLLWLAKTLGPAALEFATRKLEGPKAPHQDPPHVQP